MADLSIAIEILGVDKASGAFGAVAKGAGGLLGGLRDLGLGALGIGTAFDTVKGAVEGLLGPAIDAQQVATQTAAVLKSTGEAAGLSATDIAEYAGAMSKLVPFEDEAIQSSENLLLTFTNIHGHVFQDAENAILDMSQALGQDLKSSTIQLGKALNDPIKGISALSRVGVSFTQEQKDLIQTMVEAGDVESAQGVILSELNKEFGGAAEAAGKTFGGQLVILQTAMGNVAEAIGGPIIGALASLAQAILPIVQGFADDLPGAIDEFMSGLGSLQDQFAPELQFLSDAWNTVLQVFSQDWEGSDQIDPIVELIGELAVIVRDDVLPALELLGVAVTDVFTGDFQGAMDAVMQLFDEVIPFLLADLQNLAAGFVGWVAPLIPPLLQQLVQVSLAIGTWINTVALPLLIESLATWAGAFIDWVVPLIPPLIVELGKLELELIKWVVTEALPAIITKLGEWGAAFVGWVQKDAIPKLVPALTLIGQGIIQWAGDVLPSLIESAGGIGRALVDDIRNGISGALGGLKEWVTNNLANALPEWVRTVLGIHSPSSVFADIGSNIIAGLERGLRERFADTQAVVQKLMKGLIDLVGVGAGSVQEYIAGVAASMGIDPAIALAVVASEGGFDPSGWIGDHGSSFGPFQLHYGGIAGGGNAVGGLGDTFTRETGLFAGDMDTWPAQVRFALQKAREGGWGPWHGWTGDPWAGIEGRMFGGPVRSGGTYIVGEAGPEFLHMGAGGYVSPMGGGDIHIHMPNYLGPMSLVVDALESAFAVKKQNNGSLAFS